MKHGWSNIADVDGVGIAVTGMLIVFSALILITLFITYLPRVVGKLAPPSSFADSTGRPTDGQSKAIGQLERAHRDSQEEEIVAAIGYVLRRQTEHGSQSSSDIP